MKHLLDVYRELHDHGVFFFEQQLPFSNKATAAATIECDGAYGIFVDASKIKSYSEEAVAVAHEAGHCMTGSTHQLCSPFDLIQKHENRANKWAIKKLVPKDELEAAVADGHTEPWDLAEIFGVTEAFVRKAICYHRYGNLNAEFY